jgi:hypothetical protein
MRLDFDDGGILAEVAALLEVPEIGAEFFEGVRVGKIAHVH